MVEQVKPPSDIYLKPTQLWVELSWVVAINNVKHPVAHRFRYFKELLKHLKFELNHTRMTALALMV